MLTVIVASLVLMHPPECVVIQPDDANAGWFGASVDMNGSEILVGAPLDYALSGIRAAYVFRETEDGWTQIASLVPADAATIDSFGDTVSLDGDQAIVGALGGGWRPDSSGAAYVFLHDSTEKWAQEAKLESGERGDSFGGAVALSGDRAVVGASCGRHSPALPGRVYAFRRHGGRWTQEARLTAPDAHPDDLFGACTAMDGPFLVVGAPGNTGRVEQAGAAYVFERINEAWVERTKLVANDGLPLDGFGARVAIDGEYIVVSAMNAENRSGCAYVFRRLGSEWLKEARLVAADGREGAHFGSSVSIDGRLMVIGAFCDDGLPPRGAAYVFERRATDWIEIVKLVPPDALSRDLTGLAAAIKGRRIVVGAIGWDAAFAMAGVAYVWTLPAFSEAAGLGEANPTAREKPR